MNKQLAKIQSNAKDLTSVSHAGVDWLVVPGVPVQEQVMKNYLLPRDEIQRSLLGWNGIPLSINHPRLNGGSVNVPDPDVAVIGKFYNASWDNERGRMVGEYWIDVNTANRYAEGVQILETIKNGGVVETSTGYYSDDIPSNGEFKGRHYDTIHKNLLPDHIAILPAGVIGACSVKDGCGINRNSESTCGEMNHNCEVCPLAAKLNVTGSLPAEGKKIFESIYKEAMDEYGDEEKASKIAWGAVKKAGYKKQGDEWVKSNDSQLQSDSRRRFVLKKMSKREKEKNMTFEELQKLLASQGMTLSLNEESEDPDFILEKEKKEDDEEEEEEEEMNQNSLTKDEIASLRSLARVAPALVANSSKLEKLDAIAGYADEIQKRQGNEKANIIGRLKVNSANIYSDEELAGMTLPVLRKVEAQMNVNYAPAGFGAESLFQNSEVALVPPTPLANFRKEAN